MDQSFEKRLGFCLFTCRLAIVLLLVVWAFNKVVRPEDVADIYKEFYYIRISHDVIIALGIFHFVIAACYLFGLLKKYVTPYVLAIVMTPLLSIRFWDGISFALTDEPHPTIIFYTTACIIAAAYLVYRLQDYDTWLSFGERLKLRAEA